MWPPVCVARLPRRVQHDMPRDISRMIVLGACLAAVATLPHAAGEGENVNMSMTAQFRRCPGSYCGRTQSVSGDWSSCGPCPRGHRAVDGRCTECDGTVDAYGAAFLAFDASVLGVAHVLAVLVHAVRAHDRDTGGVEKETRVLSLVILAELALSAALATLTVSPAGSFRMHSCGATRIADFYTGLDSPAAPCEAADCAYEATYPLTTWVMLLLLYGLGAILTVRLPASRRWCPSLGSASIRTSMYILPAYAATYIITGGLWYFAYPFLLIVLGVAMVTVMHSHAAELDDAWLFIKHPMTLKIAAVAYILIAFGTAAACDKLVVSYSQELWAAYMLAPFVPVVLFMMTKAATAPERTARQLRLLWTH